MKKMKKMSVPKKRAMVKNIQNIITDCCNDTFTKGSWVEKFDELLEIDAIHFECSIEPSNLSELDEQILQKLKILRISAAFSQIDLASSFVYSKLFTSLFDDNGNSRSYTLKLTSTSRVKYKKLKAILVEDYGKKEAKEILNTLLRLLHNLDIGNVSSKRIELSIDGFQYTLTDLKRWLKINDKILFAKDYFNNTTNLIVDVVETVTDTEVTDTEVSDTEVSDTEVTDTETQKCKQLGLQTVNVTDDTVDITIESKNYGTVHYSTNRDKFKVSLTGIDNVSIPASELLLNEIILALV